MGKKIQSKGVNSSLLLIMSMRSWYAGYVNGLATENVDEGINAVVKTLVRTISTACQNKDSVAFEKALWGATALFISNPGNDKST